MTTPSARNDADRDRRLSLHPTARRDHLRVVGSEPPVDAPPDARREATLRLMQEHIQLARLLGVGPLTVAERARSMLAASCVGWRRNRQCVATDSTPCARPHEACLLAQYHHDVLLLEHGLLGSIPRPPEIVSR